MIEEIVPNLYRVEIPLPKSPLKWLNSYVVRGDDRFLIIDTGFNRKECFEAMNDSLQKLNVDLERTDIFLTHLHVDHIGLADALSRRSTRIYFNEPEAKQVNSIYDEPEKHWQAIINVYVDNGFTAENARIALGAHPVHKFGMKRRMDFAVVSDSDMINIGDFHFRCVTTPGHSPGHTCLYEANKKILVAGDLILFDITPNIAYWLEMEDALGFYHESLDKVGALDVKLVLTGHRRLVHDLYGRIRELKEHHKNRLDEVLQALKSGEKTALEIAPFIKWDITAKTWEEFPAQQKWFAFGETLAHIKYLEIRGQVRRIMSNGVIKYALA